MPRHVHPDDLAAAGGPWTRHGHPVNGITVFPEDPSLRPPVARCGGPGLCTLYAHDAELIREEYLA